MNQKQRRHLVRILVAGILFFVLFALQHTGALSNIHYWIQLGLFLVPYMMVGYDIIFKALRNIRNGQVFDENFLMLIATIGAFFIGELSEAVAVMLFYQVGELFQGYAVGKSRQSISELMNICPEYANLVEDGSIVEVDPEDVEVGAVICIKPGERIPLDGVVIEGESFLDTSALTGETVPKKVIVGEEIFSGCVNGEGTLKVQVKKEFEDSTVAKILELVENASNKKAKVEKFITRFARYYTPIVTIAALLLFLVPVIIFQQDAGQWLHRACIFLVISCPCALVISVPMGFFGGIGAASRYGILMKGSNYLEILSKVDTIVFDKTGTLTKGEFSVSQICPQQGTEEALLEIAALGEYFSNHAIANSIKQAYGKKISMERVERAEEIPGQGVSVFVDEKQVFIGNEKLMKEKKLPYQKSNEHGTIVYVGMEQQYLGAIVISDSIKEDAKKHIQSLRENGIRKLVMLTGDRTEIATEVGKELGMNEVYSQLLPQHKVERLEALLQCEKGKVAFVGDGINDAPVLTRADIGIAMGTMGSDAAIEAADVVLMDDKLEKIAIAMKISKKTIRIVRQNIVVALGVKLLVLFIGAFGMANMWEAVFADVGVSVIAILNSMRTLNQKYSNKK